MKKQTTTQPQATTPETFLRFTCMDCGEIWYEDGNKNAMEISCPNKKCNSKNYDVGRFRSCHVPAAKVPAFIRQGIILKPVTHG